MSRTLNLVLTSESIDELRALAGRFTQLDKEKIKTMDRNSLIFDLSKELDRSPGLGRELRSRKLSIKPSFYLMALTEGPAAVLSKQEMKRRVRAILNELNDQLKRRKDFPSRKAYKLESLELGARDVIECQYTWQSIIWYWHPETVTLDKIYEFNVGYVLIDLASRKALIACHTEEERESLSKSIAEGLSLRLHPLTLTKPLLKQIGEFDQVKRASYHIETGRKDRSIPENITYADENLGIIPLVRSEEENPRSQRWQSFYRIPLGNGPLETGIGVTSASGKLWIPREVPLESVRHYGIALLKKVSATMNQMTEESRIDDLIATLGIRNIDRIAKILPLSLRLAICDLASKLINMLHRGDEESPFRIPLVLASRGAPDYFDYPRLQIADGETGEVSYWHDAGRTSQFVKIRQVGHGLSITGVPKGEEVNPRALLHPLTGMRVDIGDALDRVELVPSPQLIGIVLEIVKMVSSQLDKLRRVVALPFHLSANTIRLDVREV
jgi:hypothetical protein